VKIGETGKFGLIQRAFSQRSELLRTRTSLLGLTDPDFLTGRSEDEQVGATPFSALASPL
jgi:hypothetical protein